MCDANTLISTDVQSLSFQLYTSDEIRKLAVVAIDSSITFEADGITARHRGLHDYRLGPMDARTPCHHCGARKDCLGHMGYIPLQLPVFHPTLLSALVKLLKLVCFRCKRLRMSTVVAAQYVKKFQFLQYHMLEAYEQFQSMLTRNFMQQSRAKAKDTVDKSANEAHQNKLTDTEHLSERRSLLSKLFYKLQCVKNSRINSYTGEAPDLCEDISDTSHALEAWMSLRNELFKNYFSKKRCAHCLESISVSVRESKHSVGIDLCWPYGGENPFGLSTWSSSSGAPMSFEEAIESGEQESVLSMKGILKQYGKRGQAINSYHLQAFQLFPIVKALYESEDRLLLDFLFPVGCKIGYKMFFMECIPVSANRFRPLLNTSGGIVGLHPRTAALLDIMRFNEKLLFVLRILKNSHPLEALKDTKMYEDLSGAQMTSITDAEKSFIQKIVTDHAEFDVACIIGYSRLLQEKVNCIADQNKSSNPQSTPHGIRQWIERKQGAIRQRMMGKRVNYSARTVIAPDCYLNSNEIGVPLIFAKKLTIPEYVTSRNAQYLHTLVENGPTVYPGALAIRDSAGNIFNLEALSASKRHALGQLLLADSSDGRLPQVVYRQLRDGDVVLMNRQPTLHKPGIMAHFVKVLEAEKVFRMNYVNCSTYNADFDGDEMNLHVPQDPLAMAEAKLLVNADCQFTVPKSGEPVRGLIQDHVQGGALLTSRGTFLTKHMFHNLVYAALNHFADASDAIRLTSLREDSDRLAYAFYKDKGKAHILIHSEAPAIIKPQQLWTGKQVITSILKTMVTAVKMARLEDNKRIESFHGINLVSKSKTPGDAWGGCEDGDTEESSVIIQSVL